MNFKGISFYLSLFCFPISLLAFINILYASYFDYFLSIDTYFSTLIISLIIGLGFFYYGSSFIDFKSNLRDFFIIGYLGSLTTFSTFSFEFAKMIIDKDFSRAFGYLSFNILLGFLSVYLFLKLIKI